MNDAFKKMHPFSNFVFFVSVITFSMFIMNPVCLVISTACSFAVAAFHKGKSAVVFSLRFLLPMVILISVINPVFNHEGITIITYLPWGNPLTLESILYGTASSFMLCSVTLWFSSFNTVMTTDKTVYLFGRIAPSLGLTLSMTLRFVPVFIKRFKELKMAKQGLGFKIDNKPFFTRVSFYVKLFFTMVSQSLEGSIETADSMRGRGYGLKGRTAFSIFSFRKKDAVFIAVNVIEFDVLCVLLSTQSVKFRYFPSLKGNFMSSQAIAFYVIYTAMSLAPLAINIWEGIKWKRLQSAI